MAAFPTLFDLRFAPDANSNKKITYFNITYQVDVVDSAGREPRHLAPQPARRYEGRRRIGWTSTRNKGYTCHYVEWKSKLSPAHGL